MLDKLTREKRVLIAIGIIWLFHINGLIGIAIGNGDWFIPKTPMNLTISALLFVSFYPVNNLKKIVAFTACFLTGMSVEWVGVHTSTLFGVYSYGENLGPKLDGIPYLIGIYWALLVFSTAEISRHIAPSKIIRILLGSTLMVALDVLMEQLAPTFDFWTFEGGVPIKNYITWFVVALVLQALFVIMKITGDRKISYHLFLAQVTFFSGCCIYYWQFQ